MMMNFFRLFGTSPKPTRARRHAHGRFARVPAGARRRSVLKNGTFWWALLLTFAAIACGSSAPGTIGAALGQKSDHRLFVRSMPPGQGAERAGLEIDDEIVMIDGKDVRAMSQDEVRRAVRGDVGSTLTVTILRNGEKRDVKVTRTPLLADKK